MRKFALTSLLLIVTLGTAMPASSSDNNTVGFYFDTAAESNCLETGPYVTVPMYLILTNPDIDAIYGYEFGYAASGSYMIQATALMGAGPIDVAGGEGNHIVGLSDPLSVRSETVLATLSVFVLDENQISFNLHGSVPASVLEEPDLPAVLLADDEIISLPLSTNANLPNSRINGKCNPDIEEGTWDEVKSLYQ